MRGEITEFKSKLRKQGYNLCLPLGASLPTALKAFGYEVDQDVVVRFRYDRLEIFPRSSPELLRDKLLGHVDELERFKQRIEDYMKELPPVSDEELEEEETLEAELQGLLECLVADDLDPAIAKLRSVALFGPPAASKHSGKAGGKGAAGKRKGKGRA